MVHGVKGYGATVLIDASSGTALAPLERRILAVLQTHGRLSNAELALRVHASESACSRHRRRLEDLGLIKGYVAVVDEELAGFPECVFVSIGLHDQRDEHLAAFEEAVVQIDHVLECNALAGETDYLLRVVAQDAHDYDHVVSQLLQLPGVERLHSEVVLHQVLKKHVLPDAQTIRQHPRRT